MILLFCPIFNHREIPKVPVPQWFSGNITALNVFLGEEEPEFLDFKGILQGPPFLQPSRKIKIWMEWATGKSVTGSGSKTLDE